MKTIYAPVCSILKGSVDVISINPPFQEKLVRFTMVPFKGVTGNV